MARRPLQELNGLTCINCAPSWAPFQKIIHTLQRYVFPLLSLRHQQRVDVQSAAQRVVVLSETLLSSSFLPPAPVGSPSILLPPSLFPSPHLFPLFQSSPRSAAHTSSNVHKRAGACVCTLLAGNLCTCQSLSLHSLPAPPPPPTPTPAVFCPHRVKSASAPSRLSARGRPNWIFLTVLELIHSKQKKEKKSCWLRQTLLTRKLCHHCFSRLRAFQRMFRIRPSEASGTHLFLIWLHNGKKIPRRLHRSSGENFQAWPPVGTL